MIFQRIYILTVNEQAHLSKLSDMKHLSPFRHEERDVCFVKKKKLLFNEKVNINYFWLSTKCQELVKTRTITLFTISAIFARALGLMG